MEWNNMYLWILIGLSVLFLAETTAIIILLITNHRYKKESIENFKENEDLAERINKLELMEEERIKPTLPFNIRIEASENLLNMIDDLITTEIISARKYEILLNQKNKNLDVDNVISEVASNVFNAMKDDVITSPDCIYNEKFIMSYIQKRTILRYLIYVNNNVADQI